MTETIHLRNGNTASLRPCPSWCILGQHFPEDHPVNTDDGFHHYGPESAVPTSDRMLLDSPELVVKVILKAWTHPLDAEPGPGLIELQLAEGDHNTDMCVELTPGQARAVSAALLESADIAEHITAA